MPVIAICQDADEAPDLRKTHLQAHLKYIEKIVAMVCVAGPMQQTTDAMADSRTDGSCFIYDTEDLEIAHKLFKHDPYARAGVYSHVAFSKLTPAAGHWVGGCTWLDKS